MKRERDKEDLWRTFNWKFKKAEEETWGPYSYGEGPGFYHTDCWMDGEKSPIMPYRDCEGIPKMFFGLMQRRLKRLNGNKEHEFPVGRDLEFMFNEFLLRSFMTAENKRLAGKLEDLAKKNKDYRAQIKDIEEHRKKNMQYCGPTTDLGTLMRSDLYVEEPEDTRYLTSTSRKKVVFGLTALLTPRDFGFDEKLVIKMDEEVIDAAIRTMIGYHKTIKDDNYRSEQNQIVAGIIARADLMAQMPAEKRAYKKLCSLIS